MQKSIFMQNLAGTQILEKRDIRTEHRKVEMNQEVSGVLVNQCLQVITVQFIYK